MPAAAIEATKLRKSYGAFEAVRGIDFRIERGECFGFLGPNGAGKTTTMRMIYRATPIGAGELRVLDLDVGTGDNDRAIKQRLGVVPQEYNLDERLTVFENLRIFSRFYQLGRRQAEARIGELIDFVGLGDRRGARIEQLSGGLRRRVQIARGLLGAPDILVLDEPTTGLDPTARNALWAQLVTLRRHETTIVLTTHYMDEAQKLCDRLVVMDEGRIVASGSPEQLIAAHVAPSVVELTLEDEADRSGFGAEFEHRVERVRTLADRLLLYTRDGKQLIRDVVAQRPDSGAVLRPANLEDVFIAITGHGLH